MFSVVGTMHGTDLRLIFDFLNGAELGRCRCVELQWRRISSALGDERANVPPLLNIDCGECTFLDLQLREPESITARRDIGYTFAVDLMRQYADNDWGREASYVMPLFQFGPSLEYPLVGVCLVVAEEAIDNNEIDVIVFLYGCGEGELLGVNKRRVENAGAQSCR